jgi:hypothetical protein
MTEQQPADQQRVGDRPVPEAQHVAGRPPERHGSAADPVDADGPDQPEAQEGFSLVRAFGGWGGLLDAGIPGVAFVIAYTAFDQNLRLALIIALSVGAALAVTRLARRDPLQNVVGGFIGVAIAALIANATGKAEDFYLPGLFINAGYAVAYLAGNLVRWPLIGLIVGFAAGWGTTWRQDPILLRAFVRAGWLWVGLFAVKLAVQLPLYLAGEVVALGIARVALGWPLWLLVLWLSYVVIKASVPREHWSTVKVAADQIAKVRGGGS